MNGNKLKTIRVPLYSLPMNLNYLVSTAPPLASAPVYMQCSTPGCTQPRRMISDGSGYYDYCSLRCRDQGAQVQPSGIQNVICHSIVTVCTSYQIPVSSPDLHRWMNCFYRAELIAIRAGVGTETNQISNCENLPLKSMLRFYTESLTVQNIS